MRLSRVAVFAWVVAAAALIAGPLLWRGGFVLTNDSVAVPQQSLVPWMWGGTQAPPRSVPQDALVALADTLVPGAAVQRTMILAGLLVLGFGVVRLLRGVGAVQQAAAASVAMWSTYVYERAAMGHWGLLLGVGSLAWVIDAALDVRQGRPGALPRLVGWTALGSLVPSAGVLQLLGAGAVLAWPGGGSRARALRAMACVLALQLVWLVPALLHPGSSGAAGLFGLRGEGPAGPLLTALGTGGIWNAAVVPGSRHGAMAILAPAVLLAVAGFGAPRLRALRPDLVGPLVVLAGAGLGWAVATALPAAHGLVAAVESLPGGGLLRDAQKWLAPWLLLLAVCAGLGAGRLVGAVRSGDARQPLVVLAVMAPLVLLPDLALGLGGRLSPVDYPSAWSQVRAEVDPSAGDVVSLPWSAFRAYEWNARRTVLDPAPRYLPATVVTDSRLLIGRPGAPEVVASDDPRSAAVGRALLSADPASALRALGIGLVLWQTGQPAAPGYPSQAPAWVRRSQALVETPSLSLYQVGPPAAGRGPGGTAVIGAAWVVWIALLVGSLVWGVRQWWLTRSR